MHTSELILLILLAIRSAIKVVWPQQSLHRFELLRGLFRLPDGSDSAGDLDRPDRH